VAQFVGRLPSKKDPCTAYQNEEKFNIDNQRNKLPFTYNLNSLFNGEFMLLEKDPSAESIRRKRNII